MGKEFKSLPLTEVRKKIYHYCAYQERCHQEVRDKLYTLGCSGNQVDEITSHLIEEGYLNEERFAKAFAGGKFRLKNWGKIKIELALERKGLTKNCINAGLKQIDEIDYARAIESLLNKKVVNLNEQNLFVKRDRLANYGIQKGFEPELVWRVVKEMIR